MDVDVQGLNAPDQGICRQNLNAKCRTKRKWYVYSHFDFYASTAAVCNQLYINPINDLIHYLQVIILFIVIRGVSNVNGLRKCTNK